MARPKLSSTIIVSIREDCAAGMSARDAGAKYDLAASYIHKIVRGDVYAKAGGPVRPTRPRLPPGSSKEDLFAEARRRLQERIEVTEDGCWLWTGSGITSKGYALTHLGKRNWSVHRLSYEAFVGPIPDGHDLDHVCHTRDLSCFEGDNCSHRRCLRPDHLVPLPHAVNVRLGRSWAIHGLKTECPQGHPYDDENTQPKRQAAGGWGRACRACNREYMRKRRAASR